MQLWSLTQGSAAPAPPPDVLTAWIGAIGESDFGTRALAQLNRLVPAASCAIYAVAPRRAPQLYATGAHAVPDPTAACWQAYRDGLYRADRSFAEPLRQLPGQSLLMAHVRATDMDRTHRQRIYEPHGMRERVSLIAPWGREGLFTINLYRHEHQPGFDADDFAQLRTLAPTLHACARRHATLASAAAPDVEQALLGLCPTLPPRELQVCVRLVNGLSHDGVAADLGVSTTTVKTYRNRAFRRLGIHFRSELFARLLNAGVRVPSPVLLAED